MGTTLETQRALQEPAKLQLALQSDRTVNYASYQNNVPSPTIRIMNWIQAIHRSRMLSPEEQARIHLQRLPRHIAVSMAMEGEPVDEAYIKTCLESHLAIPATSTLL
jgi:hypothetical protein